MKKKLVYIASPYTNGEKEVNVLRQIQAGELITSMNAVPHIPLLSHYWDEVYPHSWEFWIDICTSMVVRCDALIRLPGESRGADIEVQTALANNGRYFIVLRD